MNQADWMHVSGLAYNADLDQIIISNHGSNEIFIIDHSTTTAEAAGHTGGTYGKGGDILYRWGNPVAYKAGTNADRVFIAVHNPHWIADTLRFGGSIMAFNNGFNTFSKIEIFLPPQTSPGVYIQPSTGSPFGPASSAYTYQNGSNFHSANMGSAQVMPNGNLLINEAVKGTFFEIDSSENVVWEYICPVISSGPMDYDVDVSTIPTTPGGDQENEVFKIYKYASDYPGFNGQNMTPGDYVEIHPLTSTSNLEEAETYIQIYPNPTTDQITIRGELSLYEIEVLNSVGQVCQVVNSQGSVHTIDVSKLPVGLYFISARNLNSNRLEVQKIIKE